MQIKQDEQEDFRQLDDPAFLAERARVRGLLEHGPETAADRTALERRYEELTEEFDRRARRAWATAVSDQEESIDEQEKARAQARLLAVEVLLSDPEKLGNDALEGDLYILRDQLRAARRGRQAAD